MRLPYRKIPDISHPDPGQQSCALSPHSCPGQLSDARFLFRDIYLVGTALVQQETHRGTGGTSRPPAKYLLDLTSKRMAVKNAYGKNNFTAFYRSQFNVSIHVHASRIACVYVTKTALLDVSDN